MNSIDQRNKIHREYAIMLIRDVQSVR